MQPPASEPQLLYLDPRQLVPDADNVRREPGDLDGLAASLRRYGVLQPLGIVPIDGDGAKSGDATMSGDGAISEGRYRVVYGNRRRQAAILAGLAAVPCLPLEIGDRPDQLVVQLLENMQRRDLNDMEKAEGLARLRRYLSGPAGGSSWAGGAEGGGNADALDAKVASLVGLAPRTVRRYLALRTLPPAVRDLLAEGRLGVTQAQHLHQLASAPLQQEVATRAVDEDWTAALVSRVCTALVRTPGTTLEEAVCAATGGWGAVDQLSPSSRPAAAESPAGPAGGRRVPRAGAVAGPAGSGQEDDADLWHEDATGAPTPEALGDPDPLAAAAHAPMRPPGGAGLEPETADGHRVFRIRTLSAFCDEVDRLARCVQDGDLARALRGDANAATRLRLATKQLTFVLQSLDGLSS